ncbi:MAG: helix-turn-helix transcriptional regulator [Candidatus Limiplasma sp.]|nr:helix-turn-helix transcriptional regulator [Candidatus Limiplasma sp.]
MENDWMIMLPDHVALRRAREFRGMSVERAARLIGTSVAKYNAYESGRHLIAHAPDEVSKRISTFLDPQGWERLDGAKDMLV